MTRRAGIQILVALATLALPATAIAGQKPAKPTGARVANVTTTAITIAWRDRARNETKYKLRYRRNAGGSWHKLRLARNTHRHKIGGLASATLYIAQVRACNSHGCSRWSGRARGATLATNLGLCTVFPTPAAGGQSVAGEDAWNQDISSSPVDAGATAAIIPSFPSHLHPDFGENPTYGIPYVVVPGSEPKLPVNFRANSYDGNYGDQSTPGPYAIPPNAPIEGGGGGGDSHVIAVDRDNCKLYELYNADYDGTHQRWNASSGVIWDMQSNALRPDGWTSADAGGMSIFAGLARYDEVHAGAVNHAIRVTFSPTRVGYVHPGSHCAGSTTSSSYPPEGMRFRLKSSVDISGLTGQALVIATALKKYGMLVADNGSDWFISGDGNAGSSWDDNDLNQLKAIPNTDFEVVQSAASYSTAGC